MKRTIRMIAAAMIPTLRALANQCPDDMAAIAAGGGRATEARP